MSTHTAEEQKEIFAKLRREFTRHGLLEKDVHLDPIRQFGTWFHEAVDAGVPEANAMTLATSGEKNIPLARIVLLKEFDERGFVFFTNYGSHKGRDLAKNPNACLLFYWHELERQVRIVGSAEKISSAESEQYFQSRPLESRIGAWASAQSEVIPNRKFLEEKFSRLKEEFSDGNVPLPDFWGGFRVIPDMVEFWQGRPNRLHDRIRYRKNFASEWDIERLSP